MSNVMLSFVFYIAKAVENVSVRLGLGKFEGEVPITTNGKR
jgi:hypothetical protein